MNDEIDTTAEPWPFDGGGDEGYGPDDEYEEEEEDEEDEEDEEAPLSPPPLTVVRRGSSGANTASQSVDRTQVAIPPLTISKRGSETPQIASETHSPPPLTITKRGSVPIPPLTITKKEGCKEEVKPLTPPPLTAVKKLDYTYMIVGFNLENEQIRIVKLFTDIECRNIDMREISVRKDIFRRYLIDDIQTLIGERGNEFLSEQENHLRIQGCSVAPQNWARGVVHQWDLLDIRDYDSHDEDEDEDEDGEEIDREYEDPLPVYRWAILRVKLGEPISLNLSHIFL